MAIERVGQAIALLLHGVVVKEPLSIELDVSGAAGSVNLQYEISHRPSLLPPKVDVGRYVVAGGRIAWPLVNPPWPDAQAPNGAWAVAIASLELKVSDEVSNAFRNGPDSEAERIIASLSREQRDDLRETADRSIALLVDYFHSARPELWSGTALVWRNVNYFVAVGQTDAARIVEPTVVGEEWLKEFSRKAAGVLKSTAKQRRIVGVAFNWLLSAHSQPHASNERFICSFNCIEVLLSLDEAQVPSLDGARLREIENIVAASSGASRDSLLAFVQRLKNHSGRAPLTARFAALAAYLFPNQAKEDIELMRIISKARNQLVHGGIARAEDAVPGTDVHELAGDLATRYATALVERLSDGIEAPSIRHRDMTERLGKA